MCLFSKKKKKSLYDLHTSHLLDMWFANIYSKSTACLFIPLKASFMKQKFSLSLSPIYQFSGKSQLLARIRCQKLYFWKPFLLRKYNHGKHWIPSLKEGTVMAKSLVGAGQVGLQGPPCHCRCLRITVAKKTMPKVLSVK